MIRSKPNLIDNVWGRLVLFSHSILIVWLAFICIVSLFIFILSALVGVQFNLQSEPSFATHAANLLGQPISMLDRYECKTVQTSIEITPGQSIGSTCLIFRDEETFDLIKVQTNQVRIIEITLFSKDLRPEILFTYWGEPRSMRRNLQNRGYTLEWDNIAYIVKAEIIQDERLIHLITLRTKFP